MSLATTALKWMLSAKATEIPAVMTTKESTREEVKLIHEEIGKERRKKRLLAVAGAVSIGIAFVIAPTAITAVKIATMVVAAFMGLLFINKAISMRVGW